MKLKKILGLTALAAIATFALAACGSSKSSSKDGETTVKVGVMTNTVRNNDKPIIT